MSGEVWGDLAPYKRQVVRLTQERNQAREERDAARTAWRRESDLLRAQLREVVSPRAEALHRELDRVRGTLMRGKAAAQSANRRAGDAAAFAARLQTELGQVRAQRAAEVADLKAELARIKADQHAEAARLAKAECDRLLAKAEQQRRDKGISDDIVYHLMNQKDRLLMNACRYLSMRDGRPPWVVYPLVITWCTDEDFTSITNPTRLKFLLDLGVPVDGWFARMLTQSKFWDRRRRRMTPEREAVSLDTAEREGHPDIHPHYKPQWYPCVEHGGIELVGDLEEADERVADALSGSPATGG
jgi:hypothetical protein